MRNCSKCLENNWKYEYIDGWIVATCQECGNEVEFPAKKKSFKKNNVPPIISKVGQNKKNGARDKELYNLYCEKCNTKLRKSNPKMLDPQIIFLYCSNCHNRTEMLCPDFINIIKTV